MNAVHRFAGAIFLAMAVFAAPAAGETSQAYWVWSPDRPLAKLDEDADIFVLQGHLEDAPGGPRFRFQGVPAGPGLPGDGALTLVYRLDDLIPVAFLLRRFNVHRRIWRDAGRIVVGLQVDYDSPTGKLRAYGTWLTALRAKLGKEATLSITGLGDWLVSAPAADIRRLSAATDFIAFMMYHRDQPLAPVRPYLNVLAKYPHPFRLGLLPEQRNFAALDIARQAPSYHGDILFLLPEGSS